MSFTESIVEDAAAQRSTWLSDKPTGFSLDDLIAAHTQKLEALETHKKGLMQKLFPSPEEAKA